MKEPINRLPGPGFGSGSMQHYPSAKQHKSELSVFISPHPPDRQRLRGKRQTDLSNTKTQNLWDPAQRDSRGDAKSAVFACPVRKHH